MNEIPRESPNDKIENLMKSCPMLFAEMEHLAYLDSLVFNFSSARFNHVRDLSTIISFLITIFMLIVYGFKFNSSTYNDF